MRLSKLFTKTSKEDPKDETAVNAKLLERGGFVFKNSAGVYSLLPLGLRVVEKINTIIRDEMAKVGGQELYMPALVDKKYMEPSGRWNVDISFKALGSDEDKEASFVLGWSHEEVITAIASRYINSYRDLPFAVYQIQTKFRNEPRAKSGLLRGREFMMKDLYSFHVNEQDLNNYYDRVRDAYFNIFNRCGLKFYYTLASGGLFTDKLTHEFQVLADVGEDTILVCEKCGYAENIEISKLAPGGECPECTAKIKEEKSIEVGNIFNQGTKYSKALDLYFTGEDGNKTLVLMGAYGIGIGRLMATIVETSHDDNGIIWPESVAPYKVHLISLQDKDGNTKVANEAEKIYKNLTEMGVEVLFDDRMEKSPGEKLADADLLGIPIRAIISAKTLAEESLIEIKKRSEKEHRLTDLTNFANILR